MSRSPWRDALDGQVQILRDLRRPSAMAHFGKQLNIPDLMQAVPDQDYRLRILANGGSAMAEATEKLIREAEPIHMSHDIVNAIWRAMSVFNNPLQANKLSSLLDAYRLEQHMQPVPEGLIWFGHQGLTISTDRVETTPDHSTDVLSPAVESKTASVRAIYFGRDLSVRLTPSLLQRYTLEVFADDQKQGMGVMVFLDAHASGYRFAAQRWGHHLVPVPLVAWWYGDTLHEVLEYDQKYPKAIGMDSMGTSVLSSFIHTFLYHTFRLMLNRITLWGGVSVHHNEAREADKEKLCNRVQLVTWRKANYKYPQGHIPVPVAWSCRWSIREHIRRYRNPDGSIRKTIVIQSYIKGPPGKPYKGPNQRAHDVKR